MIKMTTNSTPKANLWDENSHTQYNQLNFNLLIKLKTIRNLIDAIWLKCLTKWKSERTLCSLNCTRFDTSDTQYPARYYMMEASLQQNGDSSIKLEQETCLSTLNQGNQGNIHSVEHVDNMPKHKCMFCVAATWTCRLSLHATMQ
jgi:hypothetical protein